MTRSHAPFAQTFPSANETATTKRPQASRVRDFKQTFCIQKFRDMHIYSLDFKTMPWHAWFQNKIERYNIERYHDSRSIFLSTAHAFQWKHHIYFFRAIHHIDPLHRKQTLTLSKCNSHGQPLQKPREVQEMLQIPVCQSSLVSRTFSVHIRIWMFTLCTMHLVSTSTSEPRKEVLGNFYNFMH